MSRRGARLAPSLFAVLGHFITAAACVDVGAPPPTTDGPDSRDRIPRVHHVTARALGAAQPTEIEVPVGAAEHYVAARVPAGVKRVRLSLLDSRGRVLAQDGGQGPLDLPALAGHANGVRLRVESLDGVAGPVRVYANDARDADGDGLGAALEAALGSFDSRDQPGCAESPLRDYFRRVVHSTRDSDRDGLDDGEEVLGRSADPPLDLPAWGADPGHKDLFIEADYRAAMGSVQLEEADLVEIAELYMAGSAEELKNPDGLPGVHLHVDVGFDPIDPRYAALMGDWGGSNAVQERDYHEARKLHLTPSRQGRFRHLVVQASGTGQGKVLGDHFTFNRNYHRVRVFAHELGHTLGLRHHGQDAWGLANCKPNYSSLMNYPFQNNPRIGFSRATVLELDPRMVFEREGLGLDDPSFLRDPPFELDTVGRAVDWNRNGVIDEGPVRAALTWATYKSCGELARGETALSEAPLAASTPALVTALDRVFALWISADGRLHLRSTRSSGPDAQGSCPLGDDIDTRCGDWSDPLELPAPADLRHLGATSLDDGTLLVALTDARGALFVQRVDVREEQAPRSEAAQRIEAPEVTAEPHLGRLNVDAQRFGVTRLWSVLFRTATGELGQALTVDPGGPYLIRSPRDGSGRPLRSLFAPSAVELGSGETCAALADDDGFIHLYCYVAADDAWVDRSADAFYAGLGPRTTARVGLAFHRPRRADGATIDPTERNGSLYMAFTDDADRHYPNLPWLLMSESIGAAHTSESLRFRWRGQLVNQWTSLVPGAGVVLHEDRSLSALKALVPLTTKHGDRLQFLPLADGSYGARLGSGNDFRVMETGICIGLRGRKRCE